MEAAAAANDAYLDDDEFDDYNPHPYAGGYDIAATYGSPLPPSPATCYPVASPAATPAPTAPQPIPRSPPPQPPAPAPSPAPAPQPPRPPSPPAPAPAAAEPYYWPKPYDYGDAPRHQPLYPTPEVFRGWPFLPPPGPRCRSACACKCARACHRDYWRQCMRGLDYLFGHCDGYGERRIGVDSLGVPVYANRKGAVQDAVAVEVPPPETGTMQWHDAGVEQFQSNRSSWYGNAEEGTHSDEQPTYTSYDRSYEQPTYTSYDGSYEQPAYNSYDRSYEQPACTSYDRSYEQPTYTSNGRSYEQPYSFHGVPDETTWFPNQSYQEVYREEESQYQEFLSYDEDTKISSQPIFSYNQHFGEQPLHIHVEPPETVSSQKVEYCENFSPYNNQSDVDNLENSRQSYEIQPYVHMPYDQLEPYRPSWSLNSGYYQACTEGITPEYDNQTLASDECWDMSSLFMSPFYPQETRSYEQSHGDENV